MKNQTITIKFARRHHEYMINVRGFIGISPSDKRYKSQTVMYFGLLLIHFMIPANYIRMYIIVYIYSYGRVSSISTCYARIMILNQRYKCRQNVFFMTESKVFLSSRQISHLGGLGFNVSRCFNFNFMRALVYQIKCHIQT